MKKGEQPPWLRQLAKPTGWRARKLKQAAGEKLSPTGHRRNWAVEKLPPEIRQIVFDGYVTGKSYRQIREEVAAAGHEISEGALARYWRECWATEYKDLYRARLQAEILSRQAQRSGSPDPSALVRELLWLNLIQRRQELGQADLMALLAAAREQEKVRIAAHKAGLKDHPQPEMTPEQIGREVRQIYGWTDEEIEAYEQRHPQAEAEPEPSQAEDAPESKEPDSPDIPDPESCTCEPKTKTSPE